MPVTVRTIGSSRSLAEIERIINQEEAGPWELLSLAIGSIAGNSATLVVFSQAPIGSKRGTIQLLQVDASLSSDQQENQLNASGKRVVCYGGVYVAGTSKNVAALRG